MSRPKSDRQPDKLVRCAIYTRKSTEEGLEQEFNSRTVAGQAVQSRVFANINRQNPSHPQPRPNFAWPPAACPGHLI